ncbi:hypothetical protein ACETU7_33350 [Rhodococcus sp. 3Y1]
MNALHTQVSRLRSALPDGALEVTAAGYRLTLARERVDLARAADAARGLRTVGADASKRSPSRPRHCACGAVPRE